jgi:hypothetical protein
LTVTLEFIGFGDKHQNGTRITIWYVFNDLVRIQDVCHKVLS